MPQLFLFTEGISYTSGGEFWRWCSQPIRTCALSLVTCLYVPSLRILGLLYTQLQCPIWYITMFSIRVQAVFSKVAELQACCKVVGIAFPLQQVISGTGLYSDNSDTSTIYARAKTVDINTERAGISSSIHHRSGGKYSDMAVNSNRGNAVVTGKEDEEQQNRSTARNVPMERSGDANTVKRPDEMTWQQAIVEELWKVVVIGVCAFLFSFGLKYFRGENPLGAPEDVQRATASDGTDELWYWVLLVPSGCLRRPRTVSSHVITWNARKTHACACMQMWYLEERWL